MTHLADGLSLAEYLGWPVAGGALLAFLGLATGVVHARRRGRRLPADWPPDANPDATPEADGGAPPRDRFPPLGPPAPPVRHGRVGPHTRPVVLATAGAVLIGLGHDPVGETTVAAAVGVAGRHVTWLGLALLAVPVTRAAVGLHVRTARAVPAPGDDAALERLEAATRPAVGALANLWAVVGAFLLPIQVAFAAGAFVGVGPLASLGATVARATTPGAGPVATAVAATAILYLVVEFLRHVVVPQARLADAFFARQATNVGLHLAAGAAPDGATLPAPKSLCLGCLQRALITTDPPPASRPVPDEVGE